jgi:hypothetical protein
MSDRIHFSPLGSDEADQIARLQARSFDPELRESEAEIRQILLNTEQHLICNFSFGLYDGLELVGYVFAYIETYSIFFKREEEVIYIKEIVLSPGYERYLRRLFQKLSEQRHAFAANLPLEAHAQPAALANWQRMKRFFRTVNITLTAITEAAQPGRSPYQLIRLDVGVVSPADVPLPDVPETDGKAIHVTVTRQSSQWLALRPQWDEVTRLLGHVSLTQTFCYLWEWWKYFGIWHELLVLTAWRGKTAVGFAPLMIEHDEVYGRAIRRVRAIGSAHDQPRPYFVFGVDKEGYLPAILEALKRTVDSWDFLCIEGGGEELARELTLRFPVQRYRVARSQHASAYLDLAVRTRLIPNAVQPDDNPQQKYDARALVQDSLEVKRFSPVTEVILDTYCELEERASSCCFDEPISSDKSHYFFYLALARALGERFRMQIAELKGMAVAASFGVLTPDGSSFQALRSVHDKGYSFYNSRVALLIATVEELRNEGILRYDHHDLEPASAAGLEVREESYWVVEICQRKDFYLWAHLVWADVRQRWKALRIHYSSQS